MLLGTESFAVLTAGLLAVVLGCGGAEVEKEPGQRGKVESDSADVLFGFTNNRGAASIYRGEMLWIPTKTIHLSKFVGRLPGDGWLEEVSGGRVVGRAPGLVIPAPASGTGDVWVGFYGRPLIDRQLFSVLVNGKRVGDVPMVGEGPFGLGVPRKFFVDGENTVRFYFRHVTSTGEKSAEIAWVGVGPQPSDSSDLSELPWRVDGRALAIEADARIEFPFPAQNRNARLRVKMFGTKAGQVQLSLESDTLAKRTLWSGEVSGGVEIEPVLSDFQADINGPLILTVETQGAVEIEAAVVRNRSEEFSPVMADHVLVWVVSSLRADVLSSQRTPNFSRFLEGGLSFPRSITNAPNPQGAHRALMGGRAFSLKSDFIRSQSLAERLGERGYATGLFSAHGYVSDTAGFTRGVDHYENPLKQDRPHSAEVLWRSGRKFLAQHRKGKTFTYFATSEPHVPYMPSEQSLAKEWVGASLFPPSRTAQLQKLTASIGNNITEKEFLRALYLAEVRDADRAFGEMLSELAKLNLKGRVVVLLVGDHGEAFWEHGRVGHGSDVYGEAVRIPIGFGGNGVLQKREASPADLVDVYATILALAGAQPDPFSAGEDLIERTALGRGGKPIVTVAGSEVRSIVSQRLKWVHGTKGSALFDLREDAAEKIDATAQRPRTIRYMRMLDGMFLNYGPFWNGTRWGHIDNVSAGFAAEHDP